MSRYSFVGMPGDLGVIGKGDLGELGNLAKIAGLGVEFNNDGRWPSVVAPPLDGLRKLKMSINDYQQLLFHAVHDSEMSNALKDRWRTALGLAPSIELPPNPESWPGPTNKGVLPEEVPAIVDPDFESKLRDCIKLNDGWEQLFPPRTKASLSILRLKMRDLKTMYAGTGHDLASVLSRLRFLGEYVMVQNFAVAQLVFDQFDYIGWWESRGALVSPAVFERYSKLVTIALKGSVFPDLYLPLVEATGMSGFRLLPDPAFDIFEETRDAAQGFGFEHVTRDGVSKPWGWLNCSDVLQCIPAKWHDTGGDRVTGETTVNPVVPGQLGRQVKLLTFEEFVSDAGLWATSGASSYGKLYYHTDGKVEKTKARKLMLPYITTPNVLLKICERASRSVTVALVKSELAKIRVAVSGDLGFYLEWAYIHYLTGDVYDQWPGVTLAETAPNEAKRLWSMLQCCALGYTGLPEDFKSFDKQPLDSEIMVIGQRLLACAIMRKPDMPLWIAKNCLSGLADATLAVPQSAPVGAGTIFKVKDQLPSGIAITSAVGNAFNCVASESVIRWVEGQTGIPRHRWLKHLALRGDDSSFMVSSLAWALLLAFAGGQLNYVYAAGKIAAVPGATELLRVHFSPLGARGYPARVIPSLSQRKPWSNEPWDGEAAVRAWWVTCQTLSRRRSDGIKLWSKLCRVWSRTRGLPAAILGVASTDGGLGLGPPSSLKLKVVPGLHTTAQLSGVKIKTAEWSQRMVAESYAADGYTLTADESVKLSEDGAVQTLSTADVIAVSGAARREYLATLPSQRVESAGFLELDDRFEREWMRPAIERIEMTDTIDPWVAYVDFGRSTTFGRYQNLVGVVTKAKVLSRERKVSVDSLLPTEVLREARAVGRRFHTGTMVGLSWLLGELPSVSMGCAHPQIVSALVPLVAFLVDKAAGYGTFKHASLGQVTGAIAFRVGEAVSKQRILGPMYYW